jgi:HEAT repeat protein
VDVQEYLEELADPDQPVSVSNLVTLSNVAPNDLSAVGAAFPRLSDERRSEVINAMAELAEDNVELNFDAVFKLALRDSSPEVRRQAVRGLWEYEGSDLIDSLIQMLERDEDAGVRVEAALGLGRFALKNELDELRRFDGERVDSALRRSFEDEREPAEVRAHAIESLGARSEPWVTELIDEAYDSSERPLRIGAVYAMGRSADSSWLGVLSEEAQSDEAEMRFAVAMAAGAIGDEEATPILIELSGDEDEEVQEAAIGALGEIGGDPAKEALRDLMDSPVERVRDAALDALREAEFADDPLGVRIVN